MSLILYGLPLSPFVRKVEVVLREKSLPYEMQGVAFPLPDEMAEISPLRRIPVLRDTEVGAEGAAGTIADSSAICAYAEKLQPQPALYPAQPYLHARAIWLEEYCDSDLAQNLGGGIFRAVQFARFAGKEPDTKTAAATLHQKLPRYFDYLENALQQNGGRYLVGDSISIADVALGVQLTQLALVVANAPDPARWPGLAAYAQGCAQHPGFAPNLAACRKVITQPPVDLGAPQ